MSGFPTRPTRNAFGPTRVDDGISSDDAKYVGARHFNLDFWQVAGMGVVIARAQVFIALNGATPTIAWHTATWNPNADPAVTAPILSRQGVGQFRLVYAATYLDEVGAAIATMLKGVLPAPQSLTDFRAVGLVSGDGITVNLRLRDSAGAAADGVSGDGLLVNLW